MKLTKEQANNLLTEIKEVLAKGIDYSNFVIVQKKDGLHLSPSNKTDVILESRVTSVLINRVFLAKRSRMLTLFTKNFQIVINDYLAETTLPGVFGLTSVCESILEKANKIDEFLNIIYSFDISPVIVDSTEHSNIAKQIIKQSYDYSFNESDNAFYPDRYESIAKMVRNYYPKYEALDKIEKMSNVDHTISKLLSENKLSVEFLETMFTDLGNKSGKDSLQLAKNLFANTDKLLSIVYGIRTKLELASQLRVRYENHRKAIDDTI